MTRARIYGSDTPFCAWMRNCPELPSVGSKFGFVASDNDITVHRYKTEVDRLGSREVQAIMQIEIKTRRGKPESSQLDTLCKLNWFSGLKHHNQQWVNFFGVFLLILSGTTPDDSDKMWWGILPKNDVLNDAKDVQWKLIGRADLISLLRFDLHPRTFERQLFRRHHKTSEIVTIEQTPLGFYVERKLEKRS